MMSASADLSLRDRGFLKKPKKAEKPMTRISGGPIDALAWILRGVDLDSFKKKEKSQKDNATGEGAEESTPRFEQDFTHKIARLYVQSIYQLTTHQSIGSLSSTFLEDKNMSDLEYLQRFISTYSQVNLNSHFTLHSVMLVGLANILSFTKLFSVRANIDKTGMQKNGLDPVLASELTSYVNDFVSSHTRICETPIPHLESEILEELKGRWKMSSGRHNRNLSENFQSPRRASPKSNKALPSVKKQSPKGNREQSQKLAGDAGNTATKIQLFDFSGNNTEMSRASSSQKKEMLPDGLQRQSRLLRSDSDSADPVPVGPETPQPNSVFPRSPRLAPDPLVLTSSKMHTVPPSLAIYLPKQLHRSLNALQLTLTEAKSLREELYKALAELDVLKQWAAHRELTVQTLQQEALLSVTGLGSTAVLIKENKILKDENKLLRSENHALSHENEELQSSVDHLETILRQVTGRDSRHLMEQHPMPQNIKSMVSLGCHGRFGRATSIGDPGLKVEISTTGLGLDYNQRIKRFREEEFMKTTKKLTGVKNAALRIQGLATNAAAVHQVNKSTQTPSFAILNATPALVEPSSGLWNKSAGRFKSVSRITHGTDDGGTPKSIRVQQKGNGHQLQVNQREDSAEEKEPKLKSNTVMRDHVRIFLGSALATSVPHASLTEFKTVLERYERKQSRVEGLFFLIVRQAKRLVVTCGEDALFQKTSRYTTSPHIFVHVVMDVVMEKDLRQALPVAAWILKELEMFKKLDSGCAYLLACITGNVGPLDQTSKIARLGQNSEGSHLAGRILEIEGIMLLARVRMLDLKEEKERSTQSQANLELVASCEEIVYEKVKAFERFASGLQSVLDALHTPEANEESELWQTASIQHAILNLEELVKVLLFSNAKAEYSPKEEGFSRKQRYSGSWMAEACKWIIPELILIRTTPGMSFKSFVTLLYPYLPLLLSLGSQCPSTLNRADEYFRCHEPGKENDVSMENYYKHQLRT